jgi:hypothetical protein
MDPARYRMVGNEDIYIRLRLLSVGVIAITYQQPLIQ